MIVDRIRQIIDYKVISERAFCREIGVAYGFLSKVKDVGVSKVCKILNAYPDINIEWLVAGHGEMLKSDDNHKIKVVEKEVIVYKSDPKDATIIEMQDHTIKDKVKIIELQEDKISALEKSQRGDVESVKGVVKKEAQG